MRSELIIKVVFTSVLLCATFFTKGQNQGPPPTIKELIWGGEKIDRGRLINMIHRADSLMVFKQGENVDNQTSFIGIDNYKASLQLIGKEDSLSSVKWVLTFTTDRATNLLGLKRLLYFASLLGEQPCVDWLGLEFNEMKKNPIKKLDASKSFEYDRKAEFIYNPSDRQIILSFTAK